jgi:Tfp pilus assembly protein PilX
MALRRKYQQGQVLLIVVLVMVVSLTVGLSIASKSITSLRTSTEESNSQKALAAAEAGVERAIKSNLSIAEGTFTNNNTSYSTTVTPVLGNSFLLNAGNPILQDDGMDLWLSTYSTNQAQLYTNPWSGTLTLHWGTTSSGCENAAIEIAIISGARANPIMTRYALDPCQTRSSSNSFDFVNTSQRTIAGKTFYYQYSINITSGLIARIIPFYTNTIMAVTGSSALPSQGSTIVSTGKSGNTERRVTVFQGYPEVPSEYFPYNLFSP